MISRRDFLLASASSLAIQAVKPARAAFHGSAGPSKVQVGTANPDPSAFLNFMSSLSSFQASGGTFAYPSVLNADGYPQGALSTTIFGVVQLPSNTTTGDTFSFAWTGTITANAVQLALGAPGFTVTAGASFVNGGTGFNLNFQGTDGYVEFNLNTATTMLTLNFTSGSTFTGFGGLIFCKKANYNTIKNATGAQQLLNPDYVNAFKALHPTTIRTMAWTDPNDHNTFTQHRYRKNWQTNISYGTPTWIPNCWAGGAGTAGPNITSGGVGNAFVAAAATDTPVAYTAGEVLQGQLDANGSGTGLTINVGGRGAKPIFNAFGGAISASDIFANGLSTFIYDDILGGYILVGDGLASNIPVEMQIGLANAVNCNLWYNFPPHITTAASTLEATSSVTQIATLIASTLNNGCYFEYANEVWNFGNGFPQTNWAVACGAAFGFPSSDNRQFNGFYGYKICVMQPQVKAAWGGKSGLKFVNAFQAFGPTGSTDIYRLKGGDLASVANGGQGNALWISYTGNANFTASPNRPVDLCDVLAYATYYSGAQLANFDPNYSNGGGTGLTTGGPSGWTTGLLGAADAFAAGGSTNISNALAFVDWDIRQGTNNGFAGGQTLLALAGLYPGWETVAAGYDGARPAGKANLTVECYEGAMECNAPSTGECTTLSISTSYGGVGGKIDNLLTAYKNSSSFEQLVQDQFTQFLAQSHSKTACWFTMTGGSQWSMYPGDVYNTPAFQSYNAVAAYH